MNEEDEKTFSDKRIEKLKQLMHGYKNPSEFCRVHKLSENEANQIRQILKGIRGFGEKAAATLGLKIANDKHLFDIDIPSMSNAERFEIRSKPVPLISWVSAGTWCGIEHPFIESDALEYIHCPTGHSPLTYALKVSGVSMEPEFYENDIIIVDPGIQPTHKSYVVVRIGDEATFKQLIIEDKQKFLMPCNPKWPIQIIFLPDDAVICGVVVGKWKKY